MGGELINKSKDDKIKEEEKKEKVKEEKPKSKDDKSDTKPKDDKTKSKDKGNEKAKKKITHYCSLHGPNWSHNTSDCCTLKRTKTRKESSPTRPGELARLMSPLPSPRRSS